MCMQICMRDHVSVCSMCVVYVCGACMCMQVCVRGYMLCMHVCSILCGSHICMQLYVRDHMSMCTLWRGQWLMSSILLLWTSPCFLDRTSHWTRLANWSGAGGIFLHSLPSTDYRLMSITASCLVSLWVPVIWTQVLILARRTLQPPSHFGALMLVLLVDFLEHLFVPWWDSPPALGFIWFICKMRSSWNLCPQLLIYSNHPEGSAFSADKLAQRVLSFLQDGSP